MLFSNCSFGVKYRGIINRYRSRGFIAIPREEAHAQNHVFIVSFAYTTTSCTQCNEDLV